MLLTSVPHVDRTGTQRLLNELAIDLSRHDAQLESMVRSGNTVGGGWGEWFNRASHTLLAGRDQYLALNPQDTELAAKLGAELIYFTRNGGQIASAQARGASLGSSWATALDSTIATVQEAANRLYQVAPPTGPVTPTPGAGTGQVVRDAAQAAKLVRQSLATIGGLPADDTGLASTKDARLAAYNLNMQAQQLIEPHFSSSDQYVVSQLRSADASLEDANWQLAKKPSPDGRFDGVDVPGAQRDTDAAATKLEQLVAALSTGA